MAEQNGNTGENQNSRHLDQMRDVIHSMIDLIGKQSEAWSKRHDEIMTEIHATHEKYET